MILLTDGVPTSGEDPRKVARTLGVPVFPIALGGRMAEKGKFFDIGVAGVPHNLELIVNNIGKLKFTLSNFGIEGLTDAERAMTMTLNYKDQVVATAPVQFPAQNGSREAEMEYTPKEVGVQKLTVALPTLPGEPITENNSREFIVRVVGPEDPRADRRGRHPQRVPLPAQGPRQRPDDPGHQRDQEEQGGVLPAGFRPGH